MVSSMEPVGRRARDGVGGASKILGSIIQVLCY
jgi:hypothetical protein